MFEEIPEVRGSTIAAVIGLNVVAIYLILTLVFMNRGLQLLENHLFGFELRRLLAYLMASSLIIYSIIVKTSGLEWRHLGFERKYLVSGVVFLVTLLVFANLIDFIPRLMVVGAELKVKEGFGLMFLTFGAEVVGTAFFEEVTIRAFLLPQIYKKLGKQWTGNNAKPNLQLFYAVILSHLVFVLLHLPLLLYIGAAPVQLIARLGVVNTLGILFTVVYLYSRNIILTIGVHALANAPLVLIEGSAMIGIFLFLLLPLLVIANYINSDQLTFPSYSATPSDSHVWGEKESLRPQ